MQASELYQAIATPEVFKDIMTRKGDAISDIMDKYDLRSRGVWVHTESIFTFNMEDGFVDIVPYESCIELYNPEGKLLIGNYFD